MMPVSSRIDPGAKISERQSDIIPFFLTPMAHSHSPPPVGAAAETRAKRECPVDSPGLPLNLRALL